MKTSKFFECSCSGHALRVLKFKDEQELYVSTWTSGYQNLSWRYRVRQIWKIIKDGTPYEDEVVLDEKTAIQLSSYINGLYSKRKMKKKPRTKND